MKKNLPILILVFVVIALVVLAIIFFPSKKTKTGPETPATPLQNASIAKEIYGFAGDIKLIENKVLTLEALIPTADGKEITKTTVKIAINDQTKLTKLKFPTQAPEKGKPVYPKETPLNFSDLKIGDRIDVAFSENVYDKLKAGEQLIAKYVFLATK